MDYSLPGSSIHGTFQARTPGWVAFPSPRDLPNPGIEPRSPALQADSLREALVKMRHVYVYRQWRIIQPQKEGNLVICDKMNELGGHYAKGNKSDRESLIVYDLTYMWNLNTKTNQDHREEIDGRQRDWVKGERNGKGGDEHKL